MDNGDWFPKGRLIFAQYVSLSLIRWWDLVYYDGEVHDVSLYTTDSPEMKRFIELKAEMISRPLLFL